MKIAALLLVFAATAWAFVTVGRVTLDEDTRRQRHAMDRAVRVFTVWEVVIAVAIVMLGMDWWYALGPLAAAVMIWWTRWSVRA